LSGRAKSCERRGGRALRRISEMFCGLRCRSTACQSSMPSVETVHYRRGSQRSQRHASPNEARLEKYSCTNSISPEGTARKLFRAPCTNSVPLFSCFQMTLVLISNGNQKMKLHPQSRGLRGGAASFPPARLGLRAVQASRTANLYSRLRNNDSRFTHHSSRTARHCDFLIASRPNIRNPSNWLTINEKAFSNR